MVCYSAAGMLFIKHQSHSSVRVCSGISTNIQETASLLLFIVVCSLSAPLSFFLYLSHSLFLSLLHTHKHSHTQGDKGFAGVPGPRGPEGRPGSDGHTGPMGPKVEFQPGSRGCFALIFCISPISMLLSEGNIDSNCV